MRIFRHHEKQPGTYQIFIRAIIRGSPPEDKSNFSKKAAAAAAAAPLTPEINKLTFLAAEDIADARLAPGLRMLMFRSSREARNTGNPWGTAGALGSFIPRVRRFVLIRRSNRIVASSVSRE